jgi:hypothetical protein
MIPVKPEMSVWLRETIQANVTRPEQRKVKEEDDNLSNDNFTHGGHRHHWRRHYWDELRL